MHLVQVAQRAIDLDRAAAFYEMLLETPPVARYDPPGLLFFTIGSVRLVLAIDAPSSTVFLQVNDLRATIERLRAQDVTIESEPHVIFIHNDDTLMAEGMVEWQASIRDSEGNVVGLVGLEPSVG